MSSPPRPAMTPPAPARPPTSTRTCFTATRCAEEEFKVIAETRRVLDAPELRMSVTTVRVPVTVGHSAAVWVELDAPADPDDVRALLRSAPGIVVVDDPAKQRYPMPRAVAGGDAA